MNLSGFTMDKDKNPLGGVAVEIKDERFQTVHKTESDENGFYSIELPAEKFPFIIAVRDYADKYLEYWYQNIDLSQNRKLDFCIDTLEVYGLHAFAVKGAYPALTVYFRPMSLDRFKRGEEDICPDIKRIRACVNGCEVPVLTENKVQEFVGEGSLNAYLIQVALPDSFEKLERLDIEITDSEGAYGAASIFA